MKGFPLVFLGVACVGCATTPYRTAQGTELHEETNPVKLMLAPGEELREATRTLLANGAVDLGCPEGRLHTRSVYLYRASVYLVEGCGWRATYVQNCNPEYPKGDPGAGRGHVDDYGVQDPAPQIVCQLEIIGKVELPRPAPASVHTPPTEPKASPPKP
jgi:hypothetical protein